MSDQLQLHRYIIENKQNQLYLVDFYTDKILNICRQRLQLVYDKKNTVIPDKICSDFCKEAIVLLKNGYLGYFVINKNSMSFYSFVPSNNIVGDNAMKMSFDSFKPDIYKVMTKLANKYKNELEYGTTGNTIKYIG